MCVCVHDREFIRVRVHMHKIESAQLESNRPFAVDHGRLFELDLHEQVEVNGWEKWWRSTSTVTDLASRNTRDTWAKERRDRMRGITAGQKTKLASAAIEVRNLACPWVGH